MDIFTVAMKASEGTRKMHNHLYRAQELINGGVFITRIFRELLRDPAVAALVEQKLNSRRHTDTYKYIVEKADRVIATANKLAEGTDAT